MANRSGITRFLFWVAMINLHLFLKSCSSCELFLEFDMEGKIPEEKPKISQSVQAVLTQNDSTNPSASMTSVRSRKGKNVIPPCLSEGYSFQEKSMNMIKEAAQASASSSGSIDRLTERENKMAVGLEVVFGAEHIDKLRDAGFFQLAPRLTNIAGHLVLSEDLPEGTKASIRKIGNLIREECNQGEPILEILNFPRLPENFAVSNKSDVKHYGDQLLEWLEKTDMAWIRHLSSPVSSSDENTLDGGHSTSLQLSQLLTKLIKVQNHFNDIKEILTHEPEAFSTAFINHNSLLEKIKPLPHEAGLLYPARDLSLWLKEFYAYMHEHIEKIIPSQMSNH